MFISGYLILKSGSTELCDRIFLTPNIPTHFSFNFIYVHLKHKSTQLITNQKYEYNSHKVAVVRKAAHLWLVESDPFNRQSKS